MTLLGMGEPGAAREGTALPRGCQFCPRDRAPGIQKVMGRVYGRPVFVWAQGPGPEENAKGRELIGPAGEWFWQELAQVGLSRRHCDIQNVVRCLTAEPDGARWKLRDPAPAELRACSIYTDEARAQSKARVWLVLGAVAREALFGKGKRDPAFWQGDTRVILLDHPSFFLRGGDPSRLHAFRALLRHARETLDAPRGERWPFLKQVNIRTVRTAAEAAEAEREILSILAFNEGRMSVDEEDDEVGGERVTLCVGFCPRPGDAWVFVLDHPENDASADDRAAVRAAVKRLLETDCGKSMHHGSYDDGRFLREFGSRARNYDCDTELADYLDRPATGQSYSLLAVTGRRYPDFAGYKELVSAAVPEGMTIEEGRRAGEFHLARVPLERVVQYNGCDCHVTARIERDTRERVPPALMRVYTEAAFTLDRMQRFGPLLDFRHTARVERLFPPMQERLAAKLRELAGDPELNPNSNPRITQVLYDTWGLPVVGDKRNARKETLQILQQSYPEHDGLKTLMDYRQAKTRADRVASFRRSAEAHEGRVMTVWRLTGTVTGRLSSGGGGSDRGNLQNIPSVGHVKDMLVSDDGWRDFVALALREGTAAAMAAFPDIVLFLSRDYSQMELRMLAHVAGERAMIEMFQAGKDIHAAIGALWSGWDFDTIRNDAKVRRIVKALHFGIIYGLGPKGLRDDLLAQGVKLPLEEVEGYVKAYWERFPAAAAWRQRMPDLVQRDGYIENLLGFRAPIDVHAEKGGFWKNKAVNYPIQGGAHQMLLCALSLLERCPDRYPAIRPQLEIHDSLITVAKLREVADAMRQGRQLLELDAVEAVRHDFGIDWQVPLKTDLNIGFRFGSLVEVEGDDIEGALREVVRQAVLRERALDAELAAA